MLMVANAAVPLIAMQWKPIVAILLPVILLEAVVIRRSVSLSVREAIEGSALANIYSTLVGWPLAWLIALAVQLSLGYLLGRTIQEWDAAHPALKFLVYFTNAALPGVLSTEEEWMFPFASAFLLLPFFYVSFRLEWSAWRKAFPTKDHAALRRGVFRINLVSYIALSAATLVWALVIYLKRHPLLG